MLASWYVLTPNMLRKRSLGQPAPVVASAALSVFLDSPAPDLRCSLCRVQLRIAARGRHLFSTSTVVVCPLPCIATQCISPLAH